MTTPGCLVALIVGGLQTWLILWAVWDHPQFWLLVVGYFCLSIINAVVNSAEKTP